MQAASLTDEELMQLLEDGSAIKELLAQVRVFLAFRQSVFILPQVNDHIDGSRTQWTDLFGTPHGDHRPYFT